jgi:2-polyprenyl-6-methoxyphenol hydroxylase-like FAD-dependent oxidoreductase
MRADVVIVGGGIAGSGLATLLARGGLDVVVLERQERYRDRVRGEFMPPWGYHELAAAGLLDVVEQGDCALATSATPYDEVTPVDVAEASSFDFSTVIPGVPGGLSLGHPATCQALADAAVAAGTRFVRGVTAVEVHAGDQPHVRFRHDGAAREVRARIVVGADGRTSTVRRQLGIPLHHGGLRTAAAGLLVEGLTAWPEGVASIGTCDDVHFLLFPRRDGRARLYLAWDRAEPSRFAGPDGTARFLERFATVDCLPDPAIFRKVEPQGPCASYLFEDTWTDRPYAPGAVLVGDAAGYSDPIIGLGLSIAVRDVRLVSAALLANAAWNTTMFEPYAVERALRMRRLRMTATVATRLRATFTDEARRRRAASFARLVDDETSWLALLPAVVGPDLAPPGAFEPEAAERLLTL